MKTRSIVPLALGILALSYGLVAPISAQARTAARHQATSATVVTSDPEHSPLQPLAGKISQLGESSRYASVYSGVQITKGVLDVYVVPGHDAAFLHAVAALDAGHLRFTVIGVSENYATQAATSKWLESHFSALQGEGINPGWWGSDAADAAIRVALQAPTSTQLTELRAASARVLPAAAAGQLLPAGSAVTASTYLPVAAAVLGTQVPSPGRIVVYPALLGAGHRASGYNDSKPFYGADQIKYTLNNTATCTSNFSFNGANNPSNLWVFTAAHCSGAASGRDFYTCHTTSGGNCNYNVGTVSTVYYNGADFESIGPSSNAGYVWNDSNGTLWSVNGYIEADPGDSVTVDGEANGAHYDNYVEEGGGSTCVSYDGHLTCDAIVISTGSSELCIPGDSGGPVLERESDGYHIYAVGMILGFDNTSDGDFCYAQQVFYIRNTANVRLIWGN
jgi:hypothetical protein